MKRFLFLIFIVIIFAGCATLDKSDLGGNNIEIINGGVNNSGIHEAQHLIITPNGTRLTE